MRKCSSPICFPRLDDDIFALFLTFQGKVEDADHLYVRVVAILGATVGEQHPNYASALVNRAWLLIKQVRAVTSFQ